MIAAGVGAVLGGIYGGATAAINGQNIAAGVLIGAFAGGIMGAGAGVASPYFAPVIVGQAANVGTALAVGGAIAFGSGAVGGMTADVLTQVINDGGVHDWSSVVNSGVQWGVINTASAFLGSLGGPVSDFESGLLSGIFGSVTSAVGMTIDILRNRQSRMDKIGQRNRHVVPAV